MGRGLQQRGKRTHGGVDAAGADGLRRRLPHQHEGALIEMAISEVAREDKAQGVQRIAAKGPFCDGGYVECESVGRAMAFVQTWKRTAESSEGGIYGAS